jgi:hypothetical protein
MTPTDGGPFLKKSADPGGVEPRVRHAWAEFPAYILLNPSADGFGDNRRPLFPGALPPAIHLERLRGSLPTHGRTHHGRITVCGRVACPLPTDENRRAKPSPTHEKALTAW